MKDFKIALALVVIVFTAFFSASNAVADFDEEQGMTVGLILGYHLTCEALTDTGTTTVAAFALSNGVVWDNITAQPGVLEGWEKVRKEGCYNSKQVLKALGLYKFF